MKVFLNVPEYYYLKLSSPLQREEHGKKPALPCSVRQLCWFCREDKEKPFHSDFAKETYDIHQHNLMRNNLKNLTFSKKNLVIIFIYFQL